MKTNDAGEQLQSVGATLAQRGNRYGSFEDHASLSQALKNCIFAHAQKHAITCFTPSQVEATEMICHKLARIANGDPNYDDSWRDIAGYAQLIVDELKQTNKRKLMDFLQFDLPKDKTRIWDLYVPVIQDGNVITAYLTGDIDSPDQYNELCHILRSAKSIDRVILHINTPGGILDSAVAIIDAIKASPARVEGHLAGTVASAGTIIALACDDITVADYTAWMTHNYSSGMSGKGHEMKAYQQFTDKSLNKAFKEIHEGFFTEEELDDVIDGKDIWMGKDEVLERWANKKALGDQTEESN